MRIDRFDTDDLPGQRHIERILLAAEDGKRHPGSGIATQQRHHFAKYPSVLEWSIRTISSPGSSPALAAGVPSIGTMILGTPSCSEICMPSPPNLPAISAWDSLKFLRVHVIGVRIETTEHSLQGILDQLVRANWMHVVLANELDHPCEQGEIRGRGPRALHGDGGDKRQSNNTSARNEASDQHARFLHDRTHLIGFFSSYASLASGVHSQERTTWDLCSGLTPAGHAKSRYTLTKIETSYPQAVQPPRTACLATHRGAQSARATSAAARAAVSTHSSRPRFSFSASAVSRVIVPKEINGKKLSSHPTMTNAAMAPAITRDFSLQVYSRISYPGPHARQKATAFLPARNRNRFSDLETRLLPGRRRRLAIPRAPRDHCIPVEFHIARS